MVRVASFPGATLDPCPQCHCSPPTSSRTQKKIQLIKAFLYVKKLFIGHLDFPVLCACLRRWRGSSLLPSSRPRLLRDSHRPRSCMGGSQTYWSMILYCLTAENGLLISTASNTTHLRLPCCCELLHLQHPRKLHPGLGL